ncbi:MAG: hypothetical protein ACYTGH_10875, partial [Planctomycetota bacterium]
MIAELVEFGYISHFAGPKEEIRTERCDSMERLLITIDGHYSLEVGGEILAAERGNVVYTPRGLHFAEWSRPQPRFRCYCITFQWPDRPEDFPYVLKDSRGVLLAPARRLIRMQETDSPRIQTIRNYCLQGLLAELLGIWDFCEDVMVERVRLFIREKLATRIRLDDLAKVAGLSKYHFAHTYRKLTGRAP